MESTIRKDYHVSNLDCPVCAEKVRARLEKIVGVKSVSINFSAQRLSVELHELERTETLLEDMRREALLIEPDIELTEAYAVGEHGADDGTPRSTDGGNSARGSEAPLWIARCIGAALFIVAIIINASIVASQALDIVIIALFVISYLLLGWDVLLKSWRNLRQGQLFDENFLMSVATIGAFAIGEYPEGVAVMLLYQIGEELQQRAVRKSRASIADLMDIRPDSANIIINEQTRAVDPATVKPGDVILVRPGERIPLDGVIIEGACSLDTAALTGEARPRDVEPGMTALSGSVALDGAIKMRVTKPFGESTASKILSLVQDAASRKTKTERMITKFARVYTPIVVVCAILLAFVPPLFMGAPIAEWVRRALVFLVVSCPCALVISIPLASFAGLGAASRRGILIKGASFLDTLNRVDTVVFDKTGTLTHGVFEIYKIESADETRDANNEYESILETAAYAESRSTHPIARSILKAYGKPIDETRIADITERAGYGVSMTIATGEIKRRILAGNSRLLREEGVDHPAELADETNVLVASDGRYIGRIILRDMIKQDAPEAVRSLKSQGVRAVIMLTGDSAAAARRTADALCLDDSRAELLPDQKLEALEEIMESKKTNGAVIFVGDGINDAPALARADLGAAMGEVGSDAAIEAADLVLMTDEPSRLADALRIAKRTHIIATQNIAFALGAKAILLILGAMGLASLWAAVFGDVGVALIAVLNALRAMRVNN
ncbi:MAG: heavy metal translocating P-type ATPase [Oscillospiraceae bacterium]|jgi:Cd2+/Zn2+-exporting ATPase|nr:heavy metal translocating P-type ATPase [Oscillospiraceae bacterium]